jgi:hypothetical protein
VITDAVFFGDRNVIKKAEKVLRYNNFTVEAQ